MDVSASQQDSESDLLSGQCSYIQQDVYKNDKREKYKHEKARELRKIWTKRNCFRGNHTKRTMPEIATVINISSYGISLPNLLAAD
jgi:hypothetical protein